MTACGLCVCEGREGGGGGGGRCGVGLLGETQRGSIPSRKLMKEIRPVGNPTITLIFILEMEQSRYWE